MRKGDDIELYVTDSQNIGVERKFNRVEELLASDSAKHLKMGRKWCPGTESNRRHRDFQSRALPTELPGQARWEARL